MKIVKTLILIGLSILLVIVLSNIWVIQSTKNQLYENIDQIPPKDVGLLLGTIKTTKSGYLNPYFKNRIQAAVDLYKSGKIKHILISGDNSRKSYNEPEDMRDALIEKGIPAKAITLDYAGFRTLDSVVRSNKIFQQQEFTIISQEFHNNRAIFVANSYGLDAIAFNAKPSPFYKGSRIQLREALAKFKAVLDLYILRTQPKYLGEEIDINISFIKENKKLE